MLTSTSGARRRPLVFGLFAFAIAAAAASMAPASEREHAWPSEVKAQYRLTFNGFEVGSYNFASHYSGSTYSARGKTKISALFGAFKWTGTFIGSGSVDGTGPHPAAYKMSYKTGSKVKSVTMGFDAGNLCTTGRLTVN